MYNQYFNFTLCSDLVPAISLVGSDGGSLTTGADPAAAGGGGGGGRCAGVSMACAWRMAATGIEAIGCAGGSGGAEGGAVGIGPAVDL